MAVNLSLEKEAARAFACCEVRSSHLVYERLSLDVLTFMPEKGTCVKGCSIAGRRLEYYRDSTRATPSILPRLASTDRVGLPSLCREI